MTCDVSPVAMFIFVSFNQSCQFIELGERDWFAKSNLMSLFRVYLLLNIETRAISCPHSLLQICRHLQLDKMEYWHCRFRWVTSYRIYCRQCIGFPYIVYIAQYGCIVQMHGTRCIVQVYGCPSSGVLLYCGWLTTWLVCMCAVWVRIGCGLMSAQNVIPWLVGAVQICIRCVFGASGLWAFAGMFVDTFGVCGSGCIFTGCVVM